MRFPSYAIGEHVFEPGRGAVRRADGSEVVLRPKTARVLLHMVERGGQLVARDDLMEAVWPGIYVTENGLTQCVAEIRRALGADEALLRTLPRRGYVLDVAPPPAMGAPLPAAAPIALAPAGPARTLGIPVLAVLPIRLLPATDPELSVFADILLDGVVGALAGLREPVVISANSTRHLAGATEAVPALAARLGADYLACGSLGRLGDRVRLSVEVAEGARGAVVWHRAYDVTPDGLRGAPDELATTIAHTVAPRLRDAERRNARRRQHDIGAYHLLLEAQAVVFRLERASLDSAGAMLRRAAALDPGFAAPHAALANWYSLRIGQGWSPDPAADSEALEASVRSALERDSGDARALALLGHSRTILHRRYEEASDLLERALEIAPNDAEARLWAGPTLAYTGRAAEAVRNAERAIRLSPEDPFLFRYQHFLGIAHYAGGAFEEAARWGLRAARSNPDYTSNLGLTTAALAALGRAEEARPLVGRLLELRPDFRAGAMVERIPFQDAARRESFARHLETAGVPW